MPLLKTWLNTFALTLSWVFLVKSDNIIISSKIGSGTGLAEIWTCDTGVGTLVFDYTPTDLGEYSYLYDSICRYPPGIGSLLLCSVQIATDKNDDFKLKLFQSLAEVCSEYSATNYNWEFYQAQYDNATTQGISINDVANISLPVYAPVVLNITALDPEYIGYQHYYFNLDSGTWFAVGICGYFLVLIVISATYNFLEKSGISKNLNNSKISKLLQRHVIFPTLFTNGKFTQAYSFKFISALFPNRIQFITDLFLFGLQMAFYCVSYRYKTGWWFGTPQYAWTRFLGDRTGIMAFGKIPLLILFAGRNNFLLYITGWSYSTFLHFHKVVAYWMFLDAVIHSCAYTVNSAGYYVSYLADTYFACGIAATVICAGIIIQAFHPFRVYYYEYFLTVHVIFAIAFLIMCWYHCNILGWLEWLIAACCVWFFDRVVRVIRMWAFGYRKATLKVVSDNLFKMEVEKPKWWVHNPGQFAYVYFAGLLFWENHPFTTVVEGGKICAYIRVKKGVTYRMWNKINATPNQQMDCKVCLEGPYGGDGSSKLKKYDEALLIAGGSGVPSILDNAANFSKGRVFWVAQTMESVRAYLPLILNVKIDLEIFITREEGATKNLNLQSLAETETENSISEPEKENLDVVLSQGNIKVVYTKPNLFDIIDESVRDCTSNNIGIMACGPPSLMDEIRNVISRHVTEWDKSIDFFDEFQTW